MFQLISSLETDLYKHVILNFSLEAMHCSDCPGVSDPAVVTGLTFEEALEIFKLVGKNPLFKLINVINNMINH